MPEIESGIKDVGKLDLKEGGDVDGGDKLANPPPIHRRQRSASLPEEVLRGRERIAKFFNEDGTVDFSESESEADNMNIAEKAEKFKTQRKLRLSGRRNKNKSKTFTFKSIADEVLYEEDESDQQDQNDPNNRYNDQPRRSSLPLNRSHTNGKTHAGNREGDPRSVGLKVHQRMRSRSTPNLRILRLMHAPNTGGVSSDSEMTESEVDLYS